MTSRWYLSFFLRPPLLSKFMEISLSSRTRITAFIVFFNFITRRGLVSKSEVSIDDESKRGYLDEGKGGLSINVFVKLESYLN